MTKNFQPLICLCLNFLIRIADWSNNHVISAKTYDAMPYSMTFLWRWNFARLLKRGLQKYSDRFQLFFHYHLVVYESINHRYWIIRKRVTNKSSCLRRKKVPTLFSLNLGKIILKIFFGPNLLMHIFLFLFFHLLHLFIYYDSKSKKKLIG